MKSKVVILEDNVEQIKFNYFSVLDELKEFFEYYWLLDVDRGRGTGSIKASRYLISGMYEDQISSKYKEIRKLFNDGKNIIAVDRGLKEQIFPDDEFGLQLDSNNEADLEKLRTQILEKLKKMVFDILIVDRQIDRLSMIPHSQKKYRDPELRDLPSADRNAWNGVDLMVELLKVGKVFKSIVFSSFTDCRQVDRDNYPDWISDDSTPYIRKEDALNLKEILRRFRTELENEKLKKENINLKKKLKIDGVDEIICESEKMKKVFELASFYAQKDGNILITGETGVGKDLLAGYIHRTSQRKEKPFEILNIAGTEREFIDSQLYGHKKGAFTGANEDRDGLIKEADAGMLFLDEIGDLSQPLQIKLLRVIEDKKYRRLGENREYRANTRFIMATNVNLQKAIAEGNFRKDLYYRINMLTLEIPALRKRREDILPLAEFFIKMTSGEHVIVISDDVKQILLDHSWPGNVRELKGLINYAVIQSELDQSETKNKTIKPAHLGTSIIGDKKRLNEFEWDAKDPIDLDKEKTKFELKISEMALRKVGGKKGEAWKLLGLNDRHVYRNRIMGAEKKYPGILNEFDYLRNQYEKELSVG